MAKHKSATEVTVASMTETGNVHDIIQRYWLPTTVFVAVIVLGILFRQYRSESARQAQREQWGQFSTLVSLDPMTAFPVADTTELAVAAGNADGSVAPFLRLVEVMNRRRDGDWAGAQTALEELRQEAGDDPYFSTRADFDGDGEDEVLLDHLESTIQKARTWESGNAESVFSNPGLPEDSPRVRIETTAGDLVVGLYAELAPQHVENFLSHCGQGFYDNTAFHRVVPGFMVQGGDPNSKTEDLDTWGQGGPEEKVPAEPNGLLHFEGVLAAAKMPGDRESSGSQFYVTVAPSHHLDGQHTVFGVLLEGADIARQLSDEAVVEGTERPVEPVRVLSTTVL